MFKLCEFNVQNVIGTSPEKAPRKMVGRLWFYNYPVAQIIYEWIALCYDLIRWMLWRVKAEN
jgi:hypothetical protein